MTQTPQQPRDWQKDMKRTENYEYVRMLSGKLPFPPEFDTDPTEVALKYWLQKYADESNSVCFWKGEHDREKLRADAAEGMRDALGVFTDAETKRANAAEEREQRLKETVEKLLTALEYNTPNELTEEKQMRDLLSTLYPDTPVPAEEE